MRAEGSGGNAGASRRDSLETANFILERSALNENIRIFVRYPGSTLRGRNRVLFF